MTKMRLPKPDKVYPDWSRFIRDVWMHGMSVGNMDPVKLGEQMTDVYNAVMDTMTRRNEAAVVRPSAFLACARQTYFAVNNIQSGNMPDNIGSTFAVGHLLHNLAYAAVRSAIPAGFAVVTEKEVHMPDWWPDDYNRFNQRGHVDLLITITDREEAAAYLPADAPEQMLVDFKTMGGFSARKHMKTLFGDDPDPFGYLAQLSVYADALGLLDTGAIVAGINRDSLTSPLMPRFIEPRVLRAERDRVRAAIEMALEGQDPGEEFLLRHDKEAYFHCGRAGKPGYCPFREHCAANPTRDGDGTTG